MRPALLLVFGLCFLTPGAQASELIPISLDELTERAPLTVVGEVLRVKEAAGDPRLGERTQTALIRVVEVLKGEVSRRELTLQLTIAGVGGFDPALKRKEKVVLFLDSVTEAGEAVLAYPGAVASFRRGDYFDVV